MLFSGLGREVRPQCGERNGCILWRLYAAGVVSDLLKPGSSMAAIHEAGNERVGKGAETLPAQNSPQDLSLAFWSVWGTFLSAPSAEGRDGRRSATLSRALGVCR
ncbi:hypothetical protein [Roseibium algae]|uniref:Uncharacterized protein n=1 Tax=Roseibium algae TaxID=3123038 RepID=A0ABU8TER1_9HYPH